MQANKICNGLVKKTKTTEVNSRKIKAKTLAGRHIRYWDKLEMKAQSTQAEKKG